MYDDTIYYTITTEYDGMYHITTKGTGEEYNAHYVSSIWLVKAMTRIASQVNNELKRGCAFCVE